MFNKTTHDFGNVQIGQTVEVTFTSEKPYSVLKTLLGFPITSLSCSCITPSYPSDKEITLKLRVPSIPKYLYENGVKEMDFEREALIYFEDDTSEKFVLTGKIIS